MSLIEQISEGFNTLTVADSYKEKALSYLQDWTTKPEFSDYLPQIEYLVEAKKWDELLDAFYQVVPFGTGGRRGLVGIGPNRINTWTLQSSAQGHSQYLKNKYGEEASTRGIVIAYDVRVYTKKDVYDEGRPNPVRNLGCKDLAESVAKVYCANGIKTYLFTSYSSTPELSFMVRRLNAVGGDVISASHNPPEFNGKKVVDETGGQLIPPDDQTLVDVVVNEVKEIKTMDLSEAKEKGLLEYLAQSYHEDYLKAAADISLNPKHRSIKIYFSPFHGTSSTSVLPVLEKLGFEIKMDELTGKPDPDFTHIVYNNPNPEVQEAYKNLVSKAEEYGADVILTTDPDADRIGLMSKEQDGWRFFNGNELFVMQVAYMLEELEQADKLKPTNVIIKTLVTTNLISAIAKKFDVQIIPDLLVGIKYIAEEINKLEREGRIDDFLIGGEESHGVVAGNYLRDKDSCVAAILLAEAASKSKNKGKTIGDYLKTIYRQYGYYCNYLTEIRLPGAEGMSKMAHIQEEIRKNTPTHFGQFELAEKVDMWEGEPFKSETDKVSRNVLILRFKQPNSATAHLQVVIRPSGTEPKTKMYVEIGRKPISPDASLEDEMAEVEKFKEEVEVAVITKLYSLIGIDFPRRGFLLFWQLPANIKMKYFDVEPDIVKLKEVESKEDRGKKLNELLAFIGSSPTEKVNKAFQAEYGKTIEEYLEI